MRNRNACRLTPQTALVWVKRVVYWGLLWRAFVPLSHAVEPPAAVVPEVTRLCRAFDEADAVAFQGPSKVFRPETWFHFIGGNVATQGITADLEAIERAGIEGLQLFHGQFGGAWPGVEPQIKCLSGSWDGAVRHVAEECRRLGLRFTMQNCPVGRCPAAPGSRLTKRCGTWFGAAPMCSAGPT